MTAMKAIRVREYGGTEQMSVEELPLPQAGAGQVLVEVAAAGVNLFDTQLRSGLYRFFTPPFGLGVEGAGTVQAVGPDVRDVKPGDRVCWILAPGSYATHAIVSADKLITVPAGVALETAAAGIFQGLTAHYLSHSTYELGPKDTCLVHSAAGGVGLLLCQMAKKRGARVLGAVSSDAKAAAARDAGADHVFVYGRDDFAAEAKRLTGGKGVDVVYDAVGLDTYEKSLDSLRPRGLLALYGEASGLVPPIDVRSLLFKGSIYVTRTGLDHYTATREELQQRMQDVLAWMADGSLKIHVHRTFPLAEAAEAHRAIEGRGTIGKVLLKP
jgi:NADPH2:quinone reductase